MGDIIQNIRIKETVDVKEALQGIDDIQKALGKLAIDPKTKSSFDGIFLNLERQIEKANKAMASGFKNKTDVKNYNDALTQITNSYNELIRKIDLLKGKNNTPLIKDVNDFKQIGEQIKTLERQLTQFEDTYSKAFKKFESERERTAQGARAAASGQVFQKDQWKKIQDNFTTTKVNVKEVEQAINALEKAYNKANTQGANADKWDSYKENLDAVKARLKEYLEALQKKEAAESNVTTTQKDLSDQQKALNDLLDKAAEEFNKAAAAANKDSQEFKKYSREAINSARGTQQLNSELEHFKNKAAYFFGITNAINLFKRAVRSAYSTVKDLDAVMTETAVVTPFSVSDMWGQLPEYTRRANELGVTIHDTYEAATLFYQQGLKTNEVMQISNETLKMARIAGLDAATASDRMTNALRGFNMELDKVNAQRVNDVYSKLAAITASNTDEISTAMTKVASLAHNANMEFETTAAFLAQIIESTRESAETAGTALKTVVARFSEVKELYSKGELLGEDEEGEEVDVNKVSTALRSAGINLNEYLTGAKGLDDIFMELAEKWDSLDQVQQRYIATMAAGSRQQSRFIALMSDYKRTVQLVDAANNANGASQEQYSKTLESLQTKLARLKNAWNEFILGLANSEVIKKAVDLLTDLLTTINKLISKISGKNAGKKMITTFLTAFTSFKIGQSLIGKTPLGGFFKSLFVGANGEAVIGAKAIASTFYTNLADNMVKGAGKFKGIPGSIKSGFLGAQDYFAPVNNNMNAVLTPYLEEANLNQTQLDEIFRQFNSGKVTIGQFNNTLEQMRVKYKITKEEAAKLGIIMKDDNTIIRSNIAEWRQFAAVSIAAGSAMMFFGNMMEQSDNEMVQGLGKTLKVVGAGLTAFGTIMSVVLPLQAQIGAKGITAAISSIPIVGWIALIISLVAALGVAIYNLAKNNSAEVKLEKAAEAAKEAAEAANETKEAYEKLGEAWENLEDKYAAIEEAIKGTQEWRDAIREVNEAVIELMGTYDGIEVERDENGILRITNQEEVDDRLKNTALNAEANSRYAKIAEIKAAQQVNDDKVFGGFSSPGRERYAGAIEDLIADNMLTTADDNEIKEYLERSFEKQNVNIDAEQYVDDVRAYIDDYKKNMLEIDTQLTALGSTILDKANIDENLQKYANSVLSNDYTNHLIDINKQNLEAQVNYGQDYTEEDLKNEYARAKGEKDYKTYAAKNPDEKFDQAAAISYVASVRAVEQAANNLVTFTNNLDNLDEGEKALFTGQEGSGLTRAQIDRFKSLSYDPTELYERLGGDEAFGEGGLSVFVERFNNDLEIAASRFDTSRFTDSFTNNLEASLTDNLSSGTFKTFTDNLWSVYASSGKEGMDKVQATLSEMTKDMDPKDINNFINSINGVNWASIDSIKTLDSLVEEYGISEEAIEGLKNQLIELNNAAATIDLEKISAVLALIKKIESGEQGRSFSEEQYNNLISQGVNSKDFQYNIETGNYDYIGENIQDIATSVRDYLNTATNQMEKDAAARSFVDENGKVNREDYGELAKYLSSYYNTTGENSLIDWKTVSQGTIEDYQRAYDMIMASAAKNVTENDLNQVTAQRYQASSAEGVAGLAAEGDEIATDILKQKISASGLSEALIQVLLEEVNSGEAERIQSVGSGVDAVQDATEYGIEAEDLEEYAEAIRAVDELQKLNEGTVLALAAANAKYQDGFTKVIGSYEDWIELKQEDGSIKADPANLDEMKAIGDLKKNLKEMFNLSEDVSNEFLQMPGIADLLESAVNGDTEAVTQLRGELAKAQAEASLIELGVDPESQTAIMEQINGMMDEAGTLEFGATLNDSAFAQGLLEAMEAAGMTVAEMQEMFNRLGWAPELEYDLIDVADAEAYAVDGEVEIADPENPGKTIKVPTHSVSKFATNDKIAIPRIGNATFIPPSIPDTTPSVNTSSGGGGGGGGSSEKEEKPSYWKNPYDELYNLNEKINESLRTREALERRYQKLLKQEKASLSDIRKSYYAQIQQLTKEGDLQRQLAAGRLNQIKNLGNQLYTDSEGNRVSYNSMGVTKYASYDANTGLLQIDWDALEAIANDSSREEEGKAAEAYISELEKLVSSYEEVQSKLWDIEDTIEQLRQEVIDSYLSFEDRVMDALVNRYQKEIDRYQAVSDALEKADNKIISALREQIELSRQIRDNTQKEEDITDMENRLAYLRRDTSGANDLEILKLQQNLDDARQSFTDQLIDQAIDSMEKEAELAAEQRAKQIEIMQTQLDIAKENGQLWREVHDIINDAAVGDGALSPYSNLVKLLEEAEAFKSMSAIGKEDWFEKAAEAFHKAWIGKDEAEDKYGVDANDDGKVSRTGTQAAIDKTSQPVSTTASSGGGGRSGGARKKEPEPEPDEWDDATIAGVAMNICGPNNGWGNYPERKERLEEKGFNYSEVQSIVNDIVNSGWDDSYYREKYGISDVSAYGYYCFKTGGLANFTGPAWLDGTKSKPELVLNAQDTQNFIALKDILASLLNSQAFNADDSQRKGGDNYFDIDISANIGSDYDVDKLTEKIKKDIYNDGQYRNVNTINFLR